MRPITARKGVATFRFARPATTSRGTLYEKRVRYLILSREDEAAIRGIGECSLFPGLSSDDRPDFDDRLDELIRNLNDGGLPGPGELDAWPSMAFALETALADLDGGGRGLLYPSAFTAGLASIPINGLIWMGPKEDMVAQVGRKLEEGFRCLKLKIGALAFEEEYAILSALRANFGEGELELRVDANGSFAPDEAQDKLARLAELRLHSIEQPIRAGQREAMAALCARSPLPIALDEELIGVVDIDARRRLLDDIRPSYLILKPGLLGGLRSCDEWRGLAAELGIGWWATSALETAVGLNAVAQWTFATGNPMRQGLSTGKIFETTIPSPLELEGEALRFRPERPWDLSAIGHGN